MTLNEWMSSNKISDNEVASDIGTSRSYISRLRRNKANNPSLKMAVAIWLYTGKRVPMDTLLYSHDAEAFKRGFQQWMKGWVAP